MLRHSWFHCACFFLMAGSLSAQAPSRSPKEVGEIIDAALQAVLSPEKNVESMPIGQITGASMVGREIRFDYRRALAAFGLSDNADVRASLELTSTVTDGSTTVFTGCDQLGMGPCESLRKSAYILIQPISVTDSEAVVQVELTWATTFASRSPTWPERTFESWVFTQVILTRSASGPWRFLKLGPTVIS